MSKGIVLVAFGEPCYGMAAWNLAVSVKFHSPNLPVFLLHDDRAFSKGNFDFSVFDNQKIIVPDYKTPAHTKASIYEHLPYDENLFIDVDTVCLKDLNPLFDSLKGKGYAVPVNPKYEGWADESTVKEHYNLTSEILHTQTSIQYIEKCELSEKIFSQLQSNLRNPIPLEKLRHQWGGSQPDELYLNVALAQLNVNPPIGEQAIFFGRNIAKDSHGKTITPAQIKDSYYFLSIYGGKNFTRPAYTKIYDDVLIEYCRARKQNHIFKSHLVLTNKHSGKPEIKSVTFGHTVKFAGKPKANSRPVLQKALLPISKSTLIDSSKLIREYKDHNKKTVRVTNWLNCSFIEFKGKIYFAYRMELLPFCTVMRIGLCLLDENLQPIKETNILPNLHTSLGQFKNGLHAEDPRLFVYDGELYLSYTDGWKMAQAKIDPDTLEAVESFYYSPQPSKQEKNWTFFESEGKLYSVYDINNHTVLEMNGEKWKKVATTDFSHGWKWGSLRGGSTPIRMGDSFISFFHSSKEIPGGRQYFMGAYTFEAQYPFRPISISKEPILTGEWIDESIKRLSNKIYVVFPCGAIRKEDSWIVSFGYNDYQCRHIEVTDELLEENLVSVNLKQNILI